MLCTVTAPSAGYCKILKVTNCGNPPLGTGNISDNIETVSLKIPPFQMNNGKHA